MTRNPNISKQRHTAHGSASMANGHDRLLASDSFPAVDLERWIRLYPGTAFLSAFVMGLLFAVWSE